MLAGLPNEFDSLVMAIENSTEKLTSDGVKTLLLQDRRFDSNDDDAEAYFSKARRQDKKKKNNFRCHRYGEKVNKNGRHGLSCSKAKGTRSRHSTVNGLIQRALRSPDIPAVLEPPGCSRPDGKRPDGMSLIPWSNGKSLLWDFTCGDTFAPSYLNNTSKHVGHVAKQAEKRKINHYSDLANQFVFVPVATETSGIFGTHALKLIKKIGSKIITVTNEKRSTAYLIQRISIAIQKGNVASILGTIPPSKDLREIFYL